MPNQPVVVGVDGSDAALDALRWAAREAALHRSPLTIVNASPVPLSYPTLVAPIGYDPAPLDAAAAAESDRAAEVVLEAAKRTVEAMATKLGHVDVSTEYDAAQTIPTLLDASKAARLLVVGSRGLGAFRRGLLGSVSTAVAHHAHCPVAVVRSSGRDLGAAWSDPVVVGVDGTENSVKAIEIAFDEASHRNVDLVAVYAWTDDSDLITSVIGWPATREGQEAVLAECLAGWSERYPDVHVRRIAVQDRPARNLLAQSANAQLIVVGSHGRRGFAGMTLGSTSNTLLHGVECPIIIAREEN